MKNKCRAIEKQKRLNFEVEISPIMFMRQLSFWIVVFAIFFISACAISEPSYDVPRKAILNQNAPGTVWLMKNLFLDKSEICNLDYLEYLHWCYRKDKVQYKKAMPDTACWLNSEFNYKCLVAYYLRYTFNRDYPVVGLSFSQAQSYCKWRTDRVNEVAYMVEHHLKSLPDSGLIIPQRVIFRLPTSEEWEYAAMAGLNYKKYPLGYEKLFLMECIEEQTEAFEIVVTMSEKVLLDGKILEILPINEIVNKKETKEFLDCDKINGLLIVRSRKSGDRLKLCGKPGSKSLKKLMIDAKIPVKKRDQSIVLCCDNEIVWVEEIGISDHFCATNETKKCAQIIIKEKNE